MRGPTHRFTAFTLALTMMTAVGLAPRWNSVAGAQTAPTPTAGASTSEGALSETLFQATLETLPTPPAFIRLVRITLQPGASVPVHTHPGPEFGRIESGVLTIDARGQTVISQAGADGEPQPARLPPINQPFELQSGDEIVYPSTVPFGFSNRSDQPVVVLAAVILPAGSQRPPGAQYIDGTPGPDAFQGVTSQLLGDAIASLWPNSPMTIVIDRLALAPGEPIPTRGGPVMLSVELGQFGFSLVEGEFQVSRGGTLPQSNATPGAAYLLTQGDAVFFPGGITEVPRAENEGVLVLIRMSVLPTRSAVAGTPVAGDETSTPPPPAGTAPPAATVAPAAPTAAAPTATAAPAASDAGFAVGDIVTVNDTGVRLRATPSTEGGVVTDLDPGRQLTVAGAPVEGSGLTWYPVAAVDDPTIAGFIAEEYLTSVS